jgi:hypothetical protein
MSSDTAKLKAKRLTRRSRHHGRGTPKLTMFGTRPVLLMVKGVGGRREEARRVSLTNRNGAHIRFERTSD